MPDMFGIPCRGDEVVYLDCNGHDWQPEAAREAGFVEGQTYVVEASKVGNCSSTLKFVGMDGWHNSVMFDFEDGRRMDAAAKLLEDSYK